MPGRRPVKWTDTSYTTWIGKKAMKNTLMTLAAVMVLAFGLIACGKKTPSEKVSDAAKSAGETMSDAAKATGNAVGDAAKATGELLSESKDTTVQAAQAALNGIENKWQSLVDKSAPATDAAKADFQKAKDEMAQTLAAAKAKLAEAKGAGSDAWQEKVKPAFETALQKAQKLYDDTAAKFGGK